jgi:hypothetical protein
MRRVKNHVLPGALKLCDQYGNEFVARLRGGNDGKPELWLGLIHDEHGMGIDHALAKQLKPLIDQIAEAE